MARRRRQKPKPTTTAARPKPPPTRMARVAVADDVWADFRDAIHPRSVSDALGTLVAKEVDRYRSRRLKDNTLEPRELLDALNRAQRQQADLAAIVERLEALQAMRGRPLPNPAEPPAWETEP